MAHGGADAPANMKPSRHSAMQREIIGRGLDIHAKFSQHISRTRARGDRPVAALGHWIRAGHHKSRTGRDVEGALAVAASAEAVDGALRRAHGQARIARGSAGDLVHVSPRTRMAINRPPICAEFAAPDITTKASTASSWLRPSDADLGNRAPQICEDRRRPASAGLEGTDRFSGPALLRAAPPGNSSKLARRPWRA